jgi:hypothetical protein
MKIQRAYIVRVNNDFWKENTEFRKYFIDKNKADDYMLELSSKTYLVPTIVYIEWGLVLIDDNNYFLLNHSPTTLEKNVEIDFAYYRPAT